jgi:hypothetical protein
MDGGARSEEQIRESLEALALKAWKAQDSERTRTLALALRIGLLVVIPLVGAIAWFTVVGYQKHVVEVHSGDVGFRIVSHKSPFEVSVASVDFAKPVAGGLFNSIHDRLISDRLQPCSYEWASIVSTVQRAKLPSGEQNYEFMINDLPFRLSGAELICGEKRWLLPQGVTVTIELDRLPSPAPVPARPASPPALFNRLER